MLRSGTPTVDSPSDKRHKARAEVRKPFRVDRAVSGAAGGQPWKALDFAVRPGQWGRWPQQGNSFGRRLANSSMSFLSAADRTVSVGGR